MLMSQAQRLYNTTAKSGTKILKRILNLQNRKFFFSLIFGLIITGCSSSPKSDYQSHGKLKISVFDNEQISFRHPDANSEFKLSDKQILRLGEGRIILKKVSVPKFRNTTKATAHIRLVSNGDPWDKAGSLFILPTQSKINLISLAKQEEILADYFIGKDNVRGYLMDKEYLPTLELIRFMTPFGVGHFSQSEKLMERKPLYVPEWENDVVWQQDITDRLNAIEGEVWIGAWVDVWTEEGYRIDVSLTFNETDIAEDIRKPKWVHSLVNTINYMSPIKFPDVFSRHDLVTHFTLPTKVKNVKLMYITTGHGGHSGGDEFVQKENIIYLNDYEVKRFIPWRNDCAAYRRFNPHSGVWKLKTTWKGEEIDERIASSDLSRSNWCPGSDVPPLTIPLENLVSGLNKLTISIPKAEPIVDKKMNHWLVSAYLVGDVVD